MIRLLLVIFYGFRYIYWALLEFGSSMGKKLKVQGSVESATSERGPLGLDQVRIRYKYSVNGRTYSGSFIRECARRNTAPLLRRFSVGEQVWVHVDVKRPQLSHLPSGLGYSGAVLALVPVTALALFWCFWFRHVMLRHTSDPADRAAVAAADCPAGLPGTPDSASNSTDRTARKDLVSYINPKRGNSRFCFPRSLSHRRWRAFPLLMCPATVQDQRGNGRRLL